MPTDVIRKYLKDTGLTVLAFAALCKIHPDTVFGYLAGRRVHPYVARKIEKATTGVIPYEALTEIPRKKGTRPPKSSSQGSTK
jgi:hypothetical protein